MLLLCINTILGYFEIFRIYIYSKLFFLNILTLKRIQWAQITDIRNNQFFKTFLYIYFNLNE